MVENDERPKVIEEAVIVRDNVLPETTDHFSERLNYYLDVLGLPTTDVMVPLKQREALFLNLPTVVEGIPKESRPESLYLSKFVAASAVGLFDAALNYVWNETVLNLRHKVASFDLDYFFDSVFAGKDRKHYQSEDDLEKIQDWDLIRGCKQTGIISEHGYRQLDHIRDMRNFASAAHPNHNEVTGLQLAAMAEKCILEVLAKEPEHHAFEIKTLLQNVRGTPLSEQDAAHVEAVVASLPPQYAASLMRALFGMYVDPEVDEFVGDNIELFARSVWRRSPEEARVDIGLRHARFAAVADKDRRTAAREFLEVVNGASYISEDMLAVELSDIVDGLESAHTGMNNFHNEPSHAERLSKLVIGSNIDAIPPSVRERFVSVVCRCLIGNGYGTSFRAEPFYNELVDRFGEPEIRAFLSMLEDTDLKVQFGLNYFQAGYQELAARLEARAKDPSLLAALETVRKSSRKDLGLGKTKLRVRDSLKTSK